MTADEWPADAWAELTEQTFEESASRPAPPPGYAWFGSKLVPSELEAGMITELFRSYLKGGRAPE